MDYLRVYTNLIERARTRTLEGYKENHHILPRCLGGSNDAINLVNLTAREHLIAHMVLAKAFKGSKWYGPLCCAVSKMRNGKRSTTSRAFAKLREDSVVHIKNLLTGRKLSEETKAKMSETRKGRKHSKAHAAAISEGKKGVPQSAESKAKISATLKGKGKSAETKRKMREAALKRHARKRDLEAKRHK